MKIQRDSLSLLSGEIIRCERCVRLVKWRKDVARKKVARYINWKYWGKPIPGFGDSKARLLIVGLAPAAHGGNRTGRIFTGDRSGDWLFRALHKFEFANQPVSVSRDDGLKLSDCYVTASARCVPPKNKLTPVELHNCSPYLLREIRLLRGVRIVVALGKVGFEAVLGAFRELELMSLKTPCKFGHGREYRLNEHHVLIASYHPSQQNTFTGRLSEKMFDDIFRRAKILINAQ